MHISMFIEILIALSLNFGKESGGHGPACPIKSEY